MDFQGIGERLYDDEPYSGGGNGNMAEYGT